MRACMNLRLSRRHGDEGPTVVRCDLHLHSRHSGPAEPWPLGLLAQESYSEPRAVYGMARRRGMDLVTLTDHDTVAGAPEIASLPGTVGSEGLDCVLPGGRRP